MDGERMLPDGSPVPAHPVVLDGASGVLHLPALEWEPSFFDPPTTACGTPLGRVIGLAELDDVPDVTPPGFRPLLWCSACFPKRAVPA